MKIIVGLGNIGDKYTKTRHNLGFMVIDELARRHNVRFQDEKDWLALVGDEEISGERVFLVKPTTMVNLSGRAVERIMNFYKLEPIDVWLIHDELDLEFGQLRIREGGSSAGHNGVKSVTESIGEYYIRWRIGVGRPPGQIDSADYVLQNFDAGEQGRLPGIITKVADAIEHALEHGHESTTHQLV